ncbi:MAG: Calx-beta domain-containing protein [Acidobacteriota bacterium]
MPIELVRRPAPRRSLHPPKQLAALGSSLALLILLVLGAGAPAVAQSRGVPTVTVTDIVRFENDGSAIFTLTLDFTLPSSSFVDVQTVDGTAFAGSDYIEILPQTIEFPAGVAVRTVDVPLLNDGVTEPTETFTLQLSNPMDLGIGTSSAVCTIQDDDLGPPPTLRILDEFVPEGDAGSFNAIVDVVLENPPMGPASIAVDWTTEDGTATAPSDYQMSGGTVTFEVPPGPPPPFLVEPVLVPVVGDTAVEGDESFFVRITNMPVQVDDDLAEVTILDDDSALTLSIDDASVVEGDVGDEEIAVFKVRLEGGPPPAGGGRGIAAAVDFAVVGGTATPGVDFLAASGSLNFALGDTEKTIEVDIVGDDLPEGDETFFVQLSNPLGAALLDAQGEGLIEDDDGQAVNTLVIGGAQVVEGNEGITIAAFNVVLERQNGAPVRVDFETEDGSAIALQDYNPRSGTLNFGPAETLKVIEVQVRGDLLPEPDEDFFVELSDPQNAGFGVDKAAALIANDDNPQQASLSIGNADVTEGDEGATAVEVEVRLSEPVQQTVTVSYATRDDTATADGGDYRSTQGQLTFPPGETLRTLTVDVLGDTLPEDTERFGILLSSPVGAFLLDDAGRVTIFDDDEGVPVPQVNIADGEVQEGDVGTRPLTFEVRLTAPAAGPVTVDFTTAGGTATPGEDFIETSGQLRFEPGETRTTLEVPVRGDTQEEGDETFLVRLTGSAGAEIEDGEATGSIRDDDAATLPVVSIRDTQVVEGDTGTREARFELVLSEPSEVFVTVDFRTEDGTAMVADDDYRGTQGRLRFDPGQRTLDVLVPVIGDEREEDDETFFVQLQNPDNAVLGDDRGRAVIRDDDGDGGGGPGQASVIRLVSAPPVVEDSGAATVVVERIGNVLGPTRVFVTTVGNTAQPGEDFQTIREGVTWAVGESGPRTVEIPIRSDNLREGDETFGVVLVQPQGSRLGEPFRASVVIVDDDTPMVLEAVGDTDLETQVRQELDLRVRVTRDDGRPVAGAQVRWRIVDGNAALGTEGPVRSDDEGIAGQRVLIGKVPGPVQVEARLTGADEGVRFRIAVRGNLQDPDDGDPDGGGGDPGVGGVLDDACADAGGTEFDETCDFLFNLDDPGEQQEALEAITPRGAPAQSRVALRAPRNQARNIGARLGALRAGPQAQRSVVDQLALSIEGRGMALGALQRSLAQQDERDTVARWVDRALQRGSAAAAGGPEARAAAKEADLDAGLDPYDATESPWGFFFNGRASFGDAPRRGESVDYEFETQGLTAGVDYRASDSWVLGAALGYLRSDSDIAGQTTTFDVDGLSLSLYTTWYRDDFFVDAVVSYGSNEYDISRAIDLPRPFQGQTRVLATGDTDGDQLGVELGLGYDFRFGDAWTLTGLLRASWIDATIDGYTERGAGPLSLRYDEQNAESLLGEAGVELTYPVSLGWGVLQPTVRISYLKEFDDTLEVTRARFARDPSGRRFAVVSEAPDRDYLNVGAGFTATFQRGWAAYFQADTDLERDDLDLYTLTGGCRFQF